MREDSLWVEKYRPRKISSVIGNDSAKTTFIEWLKTKHRTRKAVLLFGPPGVGKTTLVNAAANEFGFKVIEMNASDARSEKAINAVAGPATSFVALDVFSTDSKGSILFMDEVDGIAGNEDRGGVSAIVKIVEESQIPVVMAANNPDLEKLRPLKKVAMLIRFQQIRIPLIILELMRICQKEHIEAEFEALEQIAQNSRGDVRSAINDLQSLAEASMTLTLQDTAAVGSRNKDISMDETIAAYFSAKSLLEASNLLSRSSVDYDDLLMAIADNLPVRYSNPQNLGEAYDLLSKADMFRGRIGTENWHLLKYLYNYLAEAAAISPPPCKPLSLISPPIRVMTLFWTRGKRVTLEALCAKIGRRCHVSRSCAKEGFVPFVRLMIAKKKAETLVSWFGFEPDEVDFLTKMNRF